jgi:branched-chain amino acid transport system permease protein
VDLANVIGAGVLLGGIYALISIGLTLIFGVIRVVNFAQGEFVMLGMYGAYAAHAVSGVDPYLSILVVAPAAFLLGVVIQRVVIQPLLDEPLMQVFATFGLVIIFQNVVLWATGGVPKTVRNSFSGSSVDLGFVTLSAPRVVVFIVATALAVGLVLFLRRTVLGTAIRAVSQDRDAAELMGIDVPKLYMLTFGIGTALAAIAGVLLAPVFTLTPTIGFNFILPAFAVVILGGFGSVKGAYLGGLIVGVVESLAGYYLDPSLKQAVWFTLFIAVLVIRPQGFFGRVGEAEAAA